MICPLALPRILADVPQTEVCGADRPQLQARYKEESTLRLGELV
jgi:hypothetical protein